MIEIWKKKDKFEGPRKMLLEAQIRGNLDWPQSLDGIMYVVGDVLLNKTDLTLTEFIGLSLTKEEIDKIGEVMTEAHRAQGIPYEHKGPQFSPLDIKDERINNVWVNGRDRLLGYINHFINFYKGTDEPDTFTRRMQKVLEEDKDLRKALSELLRISHESLNDPEVKEALREYRSALIVRMRSQLKGPVEAMPEMDKVREAVKRYVVKNYCSKFDKPSEESISRLVGIRF